jgi:small-conductance mechanosensitive channel
MLYLAQVCKNRSSGQIELQLLAHQQSACAWQLIGEESLPLAPEENLSEGLLVLVEVEPNQKIRCLEPAKEWILSLISKYLVEGAITPEYVRQEEARIEQWRQEMTAQSLELTRRQLEVETHRDQLQELENSLKQEKERLEELLARLNRS